jgi:hypothetical protein
MEGFDAARKRLQRLARFAGITIVDIRAPAFERDRAVAARQYAVVGDIVDGAAKRVHLVHRIALRRRQDAHGEIERATRRYFRDVGSRIFGDQIGNGQDELRCGAPKGSLEIGRRLLDSFGIARNAS